MKKQTLLAAFLGLLIAGTTMVSCSKSSPTPTDKEEPGKEEPGKEGPLKPTDSPYLKGSDYYLIALDSESEKHIKSKIKQDLRTDDENMHLYIWEGTYSAGTSSGPNAFGEVEGWTSLIVGSVGWSGFGFSTDAAKGFKADLTGITGDHYLHFAIKSKDKASHQLILNSGIDKDDYKIVIGSESFEGTAPTTDFERDGEWHHIEIKMSTLFEKGLKYRTPISANILAILSGPVAGTTLDIDGIFFYKK